MAKMFFFFFFFLLNTEFYRVVWTSSNALLTVRSEMLPFSGNIQNSKIFGVPPPPPPPEHFAKGYVHNLTQGNIALPICRSKQLQEGLMVFSDDFLHFLRRSKKKLLNSPKLSCGLMFFWSVIEYHFVSTLCNALKVIQHLCVLRRKIAPVMISPTTEI